MKSHQFEKAIILALSVSSLCLFLTAGCGGGQPMPAGDAGPDSGENADGGKDSCGDGTCSNDENCLDCPGDCSCRCGDGICTFGEACGNCPQDCDCATLAATPPMGWNSWNRFGCDIDENLIREVADAMVTTGMREAGYVHLNIDDCWQSARGKDGQIVPDPERFKNGIKPLADYVHEKKLKFGLYTCAGTLTCQKKPGSFGYEFQDAKTYASWGADYVKVDWCSTTGLNPQERFSIMRDAIADSGRAMILSICEWGVDSPWVWGPADGQLWRTSMDIWDSYASMITNFDIASALAAFPSGGHWNDPDMLEVGNGSMTDVEYKTHMSLWAVITAPLISGNDIRTMSDETKKILLNREIIAVDQDPSGLQGVKVASTADTEVWSKPVTLTGGRAAVLFNRSEQTKKVTVRWKDIGLAGGKATVRDLWEGKDLGEFGGSYSTMVPSHGVAALLVVGSENVFPAGTSAVSGFPWKYAANASGEIGLNSASGGGVMTIAGKTYENGVGVRGAAVITFNLNKRCKSFNAVAGLDDRSGEAAAVAFTVHADGEKLFESAVMRKGSTPLEVSSSLAGRRELKLVVTSITTDVEDNYADWADAKVTCD